MCSSIGSGGVVRGIGFLRCSGSGGGLLDAGSGSVSVRDWLG
jgi:hypothetical protein